MLSNDNSIRILIVDDDEDDFLIISDYIRGIHPTRFILNWCYNYLEALSHMKNHAYDLYFVDYRLGAKTGLELLKEAISLHCEEPIVLLTGKGNFKVDIEAMQAGAFDYLVKTELTAEKLERCIRYSLERSATMKALTANERKFRIIFERSKDAVFITGSDHRFVDINDATCRLFGYTRNELLNKNLSDLFQNEAVKKKYLEQLEINKEVVDIEVDLVTSQQFQINCIISASAEADLEGEVYVQGIIHDITNLRRIEKATLQAEKLAAASRLVRILAHEVRNPLNNINLSVEQLKYLGTPPNEERIFLLEVVKRNSKRIGALISELLDSSRPADLVMEKESLQVIMDDAINSAVDRLKLQKINLKINYSSEPAIVLADKVKLRIAFLNILINAIEAIDSRPGNIDVEVVYNSPRHIVKINDNGCGISEENLSRLFEPYFTSKRNGLGLGLASTLTILQAHKASVEVNSRISEGTMFTLSFENAS